MSSAVAQTCGLEGVSTSLSFSELDLVPLDLGGMAQSGIHRQAYSWLRMHTGLLTRVLELLNVITQMARPQKNFRDALGGNLCMAVGRRRNKREFTASTAISCVPMNGG